MRTLLCLSLAGVLLVSCQTRAAREQRKIADRQELLRECEHIWFNDNATRAHEMWSCRKPNGVARYLSADEQEVLMLRDYRTVKDDIAYVGQQSGQKNDGQMAPEEIEWVIRKNALKLSVCDRHLGKIPRNPPLVKVYLNIKPTGAVDKAQLLSSTVNKSTYQKCLVKEMKRWEFPELRSGLKNLEVRYPITVGR